MALVPIVKAVQRDNQVDIYGPDEHHLCTIYAGDEPNDGLKAYTLGSVTIRRGTMYYVYDAQGREVWCVYAPGYALTGRRSAATRNTLKSHIDALRRYPTLSGVGSGG